MALNTFEYQVLLDIRSNLRQINRGQGQQGVSPQAYAEVRAHCLYLADLVDRQRQELDRAAGWRGWGGWQGGWGDQGGGKGPPPPFPSGSRARSGPP